MGIVMSAPSSTGTASAKDSKNKDDKSEDKPRKESVQKWVTSIEELVKDRKGVEEFRKFLESLEDEDEEGEKTKYLDMYIKIRDYKKQMEELENVAKDICETFLKKNSEKKITVEGNEEVCKKVEEGLDVDIFKKQQERAEKFLNDNFYNKFCDQMRKLVLEKK